MNPEPTPLRQTTRQEVEVESVSQNQHTQAALEFESPEALLRHDRAQTTVPEGLARRIADQAADPAPTSPAAPWWRRLF